MALNLVTLGVEYFPDPTVGRPVFNGSIFVGEPDTDPEILGNQKQVTLRQEDGTEVPVDQPVNTGAGGVPLYQGSPVQILVSGNYSLKVLNQAGSQVYYIENALDGVPVTVNEVFLRFDTVSDMDADTTLAIGDIVKTAGRLSKGDSGDNMYEIVVAATGTDDGGSFIDLSGSGHQAKALFPRGIYTAEQWGAGGSGDRSTELQAFLDYLATLENGKGELAKSSSYKSDSGLTIDTNVVKLNANGSTIDFSGMTTGVSLKPVQSTADVNVATYQNHAHSIDNLIMIGPGVATTAVTAVEIDDGGVGQTLAGLNFNNCAFVNFAKDVRFGIGSFFTLFKHCNFTQLSGTATLPSIELPDVANAGERNSFYSCTWNNKAKILEQAEPDADTMFVNCSFDGFVDGLIVTGGLVTATACHWEGSSSTGYYGSVTGVDTGLNIHNAKVITQASRPAESLFNSDSTSTQGGVIVDGMDLSLGVQTLGSSTVSVPVVGGTGRSAVSKLTLQAGGQKPTISNYQNRLSYPSIESANFTDDWTLSGTNPPAQSAAQARTGTFSLNFPLPVGATTSIGDVILPVEPGQYVTGEFWYLIPATTATGWTYAFSFDWLDGSGNVLSNAYSVSLTTTQVTWFKQLLSPGTPAPMGSKQLRFRMNGFGPTAVAQADLFLDDINVNIV